MTDMHLHHLHPDFWMPAWPELLKRRCHVTTCTIDIEHSEDSLHAHVSLDDGSILGPGDKMLVQGPPIRLSFGEKCTISRPVSIERAFPLERLWIQLTSYFELSELYDVSFTSGRLP
ncbi:hypothetical protein [Candidatus Phycosocius spiralis]|uniref:Uncharacterized protein n=1 Tax=Candidatus Phycosocius spiralis TaxID=2815099 RepID=A0ABQ4PUI8_9PROT|nr:hypothetical protein [Candidatus Phycosocius spiralis]GIU66682.1 hypothetical protein PsB1_0836 [Candidatus Phycosocius spiralis]